MVSVPRADGVNLLDRQQQDDDMVMMVMTLLGVHPVVATVLRAEHTPPY